MAGERQARVADRIRVVSITSSGDNGQLVQVVFNLAPSADLESPTPQSLFAAMQAQSVTPSSALLQGTLTSNLVPSSLTASPVTMTLCEDGHYQEQCPSKSGSGSAIPVAIVAGAGAAVAGALR